MSVKPKFLPGTTYKTMSRIPRLCTVTGVHKTCNSDGQVVKVRYSATHELLVIVVTEHDISEATIAAGLVNGCAI